MSELKTIVNDRSVTAFLNKIADEESRQDCFALLKLMKQITGKQPKMWGPSIVGFGSYHYKYESGHEGDCPLVGFSPRKQSLTVYIMSGFDRHKPLMKKLGVFKTGKSCLYIKKVEDVDLTVLKELITRSVKHTAGMYK